MATIALDAPPRPYEAADLMSLKRSELLKLIERQRSCWPDNIPLNSKTNKTELRTVLLDIHHGFTTTQPRAPIGFTGDMNFDPFAVSHPPLFFLNGPLLTPCPAIA
ncbi:hypothetical protein C0989_009459 [Termitomyces sp. Mn162]|nr:hypothetical protein C0989_009459 [Termitomyces sp. Mn162]